MEYFDLLCHYCNIFVLYFKLRFINIFKHTAAAHLIEHSIDMTLIHYRKPKICVTSFIEVTWKISEICLYKVFTL